MERALRLPGGGLAAALRAAAVLVAVVAVAAVHLPHRPATLCPLRALTGVPCPICGSTTAAVALGHADLGAALRANPLSVLGAGMVVAAPLGLARWWSARPRALRLTVGLLAALAAETWQLHRFGFLAVP